MRRLLVWLPLLAVGFTLSTVAVPHAVAAASASTSAYERDDPKPPTGEPAPAQPQAAPAGAPTGNQPSAKPAGTPEKPASDKTGKGKPAPAKTPKMSKAEEKALLAKLPEQYRVWLEEVDALISPDEKATFLRLEKDYQRDNFIERFWEVRDPYPDTSRNELRESWDQRLQMARSEFGGLQEDRSRMLLLNGPPDARLHGRCTGLWPLEIWYYEGTEHLRDKFFLVFVQRFGQGPYRIWQPAGRRKDWGNVLNHLRSRHDYNMVNLVEI